MSDYPTRSKAVQSPGLHGAVTQRSRRITVIDVTFSTDGLDSADEYLIQVNGVQVARWDALSRNARRAGIE